MVVTYASREEESEEGATEDRSSLEEKAVRVPSKESGTASGGRSIVGTLSLKRYAVARMGSRTRLFSDDEAGKKCEVWNFDEDVFAMGVVNLFEHGLLKAAPSVVLALAVSFLQFYIVIQVLEYIMTHEVRPHHAWLLIRALCSGLCLLQLSDEAVEGLHKVIFCIRWGMGAYAGHRCVAGAVLGAVLGILQVMGGVITCAINIQVIFHSETILDTFFNYVALAFITDIDNIIVNSRMLRTFKEVKSEIRARWAAEEKLEMARERWPQMVVTVTGTLYLAMTVLDFWWIAGSIRFIGSEREQGPFGFAKGTATWFLGCVALLTLTQWLGPCPAASVFTAGLFLLQIAIFALRLLAGDPDGCSYVNAFMRDVMFVFMLTTVPMSLALQEEPFAAFTYIPFQIKAIMIIALTYVYEVRHFKC